MTIKQFYGLKYPFTSQNDENYFVDTNYDLKEYVRSLLMHIVFTPKGQKIRDPEFGTNLIKYIFEPSDEISWGEVKTEVQDAVKKYVPNITINELSVLENDDDTREIYVRLDYTVNNGIGSFTDSVATSL